MMFRLLLFYSLGIGVLAGLPNEATGEAAHLDDRIREAVHDILAVRTAVYDARIAKLESQMQAQDIRIHDLETRGKYQTLIIDELNERLDVLSTRGNGHKESEPTPGIQDNMEHNLSVVSEELNKAQPARQSLKRRLGKPARVSRSSTIRAVGESEIVAFTAYLDHDIPHMADGHTVKFNRVHLNEGNGYNTFTGAFTVPVSGIYLFSFNYNSHYRLTVMELMIDGVEQAAAVASPVSNHEAMGGQTVVVRVSAGQSVTVEDKFTSDGELFVGGPAQYATFAGVLLG